MTTTFPLVIDGAEVLTSKNFGVINPATGSEFARSSSAEPQHIEAAVAAAKAAFPKWAATPIDDRAALLGRFADALDAEKQSLAELLSLEQGKPVQNAVGEILGSIHWLRSTAALRPPVEVLQDDDKSLIEVHRKPLGVVASITPWNFPVMIAIWHIAPALLAGNAVVLKPSESTPLTTLKMGAIASRIFPAGVLNVLAGQRGLGSALTGHRDIAKIVFTGSTPTGRNIMSNAAGTLKRLTLELGGNDAAIVLPDADIDAIAPKIFAKAFGNSGQVCAALKRLYVHKDIHDRLAEKLAELARAAKVGPGSDPATQFGPLQNRAQFDLVCELADDARVRGGKFLAGGEPLGGDGYFYPLTIVTEVTDGVRLVDEEQFGPILPVIRYSDVDDAIARANNNENGLGGSIWSSDVTRANELARRLESGTAWVNDHGTISPTAPFGGAKQSGIGVEFGSWGLEENMQLQTVRINRQL
ncbi:MAG: aldehyde dehydrogenase family protein [Rhizobiaceae bacterium]